MQLTIEQKQLIGHAIADDFKMRNGGKDYSQSAHARYLGINASIYSRVAGGELERVLSDLEWTRVAKKLLVDLSGQGWKIAKTPVYQFVTGQLSSCQKDSLSAINCDLVGIGKTTAAEMYAAHNPNTIYIKCREGITRADLMRQMAQAMGLEYKDRVTDIRDRVELHLLGLKKPLLILDDAGYMNDRCWMEIKGLYDVTEYGCGFYIIGDTSLRKKIEKLISKDKIGWEALFDRFNRKFQAISEHYTSDGELAAMKRQQAMMITELNMPGLTGEEKKQLLAKCQNSLRVLRKEISKRKNP